MAFYPQITQMSQIYVYVDYSDIRHGVINRIRDPRTYAIIGAAIEVHRHLGSGFLDAVYQEALAIELRARDIAFAKEADLAVSYKGTPLQCAYRADFVCFGEVIVELKVLRTLSGTEEAQIIHYLKASGYRTGLLLNFGTPSLEFRRFVHTPGSQHLRPSA